MIRKIHWALFVFCLIVTEPHKAQESFASRYLVSYLTMNEGLLHQNVSSIYKDKPGFIWIATKGGGLSRFDGYDFIHFNTHTSHIKLRSNFIATVCEDDFDRLWITTDEGTDILSLNTLQLSMPETNIQQLQAVLSAPATKAAKDSLGNIWLHTGSALHKISFNSKGDVASVATLSTHLSASLPVVINDIDKDGSPWVGQGNTIYKVSAMPHSSKTWTVSPIIKLDTQTIIHVICHKENELWIGTANGLYHCDKSMNTLKRYSHNEKNIRSLSQNYITDIAISEDKQVLISTFQGINVYNPATDDFERISKTKEEAENGLNSDFVNCMLIDQEKIWIGSDVGGINKMVPRRLSVSNYVHDKKNPYSLSQNLVNAIYEDKSDNLWVGTVEGGLNKKAKGSEHFTHYTTHTPTPISHNTVSSITADNRNRLWVGTWGWGITVLDLTHSEHRVLKHINPFTHPNYSVAFIESLCYDSINNGIWIGSNPGIFFYDLKEDQLINPFEPDVTYQAYKTVGSAIDSYGNLWIGSVENGLFVIDLHSRREDKFNYRHFAYKLDNPESGVKERITSICQASDGSIWVGSNGHGFYKSNRRSANDYVFTRYDSSKGLVNNSIRGILEDHNGFLWISTNYGLSCFDPANETFLNYTKEDGLINNQFYWNAYHKSKNGDLYFGGINGLTVIRDNLGKPVHSSSKVVFTRLTIKNEEIFAGDKGLSSDISKAQKLCIHERDNSFSLEFSSLDYESHATATYCYRLVGFDDQWIDVPASRRFAVYTNIPPGNYTFQVKYVTNGKSEDPHILSELKIAIEPFFYKTWWFITLTLLIISGFIVYVHLGRMHFLQKQKQLLHKKVEERTRELNEQNRKINQQKNQLVEMSKRVQEMTLDKLSFFTNITHELRTPITLITGPIERALKLSSDPQVTEQLHFVERNSKYLLSLVNQLMDFRKMEAGKQEILKTNADFLQFIAPLLTPFEVFASERSISLRTHYHIHNPEFLFDQDAIQKIVTNLLSNAIKFTPNGGVISVYIAAIPLYNGQEKLFICVKDTGTGIKEEDIPRIFDKFYQSRSNTQFPVYGQSGTGVGLYLTRCIVKLHHGKITVRNNPKTGSSFRILLPLEREKGTQHAIKPSELHLPLLNQAISPPADSKSGKLMILIVDDNNDMRKYIRSILEEPYNILEAESGSKAMGILIHTHIDFIISDLMMPVMDGMELSRKVKQNFAISHIPFLMLTAKTSHEAQLESYKSGVDEYIRKPFSEELLLARISNILENRKRHQQRFALRMEMKELQMDEKSKDKEFIDRLMEVIRLNYTNPYYGSVDFITDMGISKSVLNKKMQGLTGQSIGQFIRNYRLHIAYELLRKNQTVHTMSIAEIAYEVGFNDPKYFTRCFTKRYGTTPSTITGREESVDSDSV